MIDRFSGKQEIGADVVVVGYGSAAAIMAYDKWGLGYPVRENACRGGNTRLAGGGIVTPTSITPTGSSFAYGY